MDTDLEQKVRDLFVKANLPGSIKDITPTIKGYSNFSFCVSTNEGNKYKLRIAANNDLISRDNELNILRNTGETYIYYDKETGDSVWKWWEGSDLIGKEITKDIMEQVTKIIEDIHTKPTDGVMVHNDLEFVPLYGQHIEPEDLDLYRSLVIKYQDERRCLCHNDVSLSNLIIDPTTGKLKLIDYEWGRVNNPYWDYGNFVKETGLSDKDILLLSQVANISLSKLYEFSYLAVVFSLLLSYTFKPKTKGVEIYRERLKVRLKQYKEWLLRK